MQADILNIRKLKRSFDIIESAGVLHHMRDPMTGWESLVDCLKPNGLMHIGLYSQLGRSSIQKLRDEIDQLSIKAVDEDMKAYRDNLIKSKKVLDQTILRSNDFYSTSMFRDLLFHVQEHQFTLPEIKQSLSSLNLTFSGFEAPKALAKFKLTYHDQDDLYNLEKWHDFELNNPSSFVGMYQFWCQKIS